MKWLNGLWCMNRCVCWCFCNCRMLSVMLCSVLVFIWKSLLCGYCFRIVISVLVRCLLGRKFVCWIMLVILWCISGMFLVGIMQMFDVYIFRKCCCLQMWFLVLNSLMLMQLRYLGWCMVVCELVLVRKMGLGVLMNLVVFGVRCVVFGVEVLCSVLCSMFRLVLGMLCR